MISSQISNAKLHGERMVYAIETDQEESGWFEEKTSCAEVDERGRVMTRLHAAGDLHIVFED